MADWPGKPLKSGACWGWHCEGRTFPPGAAYLVRYPESLVSEGRKVKAPTTTEVEASAPGTGALIIHPGTFPARLATVTAEVLCRFLAGERMASLEAVNEASTTRLAAVVEYLQSRYGWSIDRHDKANGCRDGRVSWVSVYYLPPETIAQAMAEGAASWCASVKTARAALRKRALHAAEYADRVNSNAARTRKTGVCHLGQGRLFEAEGAAYVG